MENPPLVTVLMPVHNGAPYLREAVDSVLGQTLQDFELLVVDDASQDESSTILSSYTDSRLRYIRSDTRLRLVGALNLGLSEARGEFIARMDCDDVCLPARLQKQVAAFVKDKELVLCGTAVDTIGSGAYGKKIYPSGTDNIRAYLLFDNPFAHPTVMFRSRIFREQGLQYDADSDRSEDYALWSEVASRFKCDNLKTPLLHYRIHAASVTRTYSTVMDKQAMRVQQKLFGRLGLHVSEEELLIHRFGTTHRLYPQNDMASLRRLGQWYSKLQQQILKTTQYNHSAFGRYLSEFWYAACYQAMVTIKTSDVFSCYFASRPPARGVWGGYYDLLFMLAWTKNRITRK